jgi:tripartite-type tricarboxylate transporter receptor subunit TctC
MVRRRGYLEQSIHSLTRRALIAQSAGLACLGTATAADYPLRPVKWVVPYPPGGTTDVLARIMAQWRTDKLGQQFVVENKPGAGNNIGTEAVINAPPDGDTMLLVNPAHGSNASLYKKLNYNSCATLPL